MTYIYFVRRVWPSRKFGINAIKLIFFHCKKKPNARVFKRLQYSYDVTAEFFEVHILRSLPIRLIFITIFPIPFFSFSMKKLTDISPAWHYTCSSLVKIYQLYFLK